MSIIPDKNLFLVTSCVNSVETTYFDNEMRFQQTLVTLDSINHKAPGSIVVVSDASVIPLTEYQKQAIGSRCSVLLDVSTRPEVQQASRIGAKSYAENALMFVTLSVLKEQPWFKEVKRVFKISARSWMEEGFNLSDYDNMFGKYVFKKRIPTWMNPQMGGTHLLITRFFSMCASLVDNYLEVSIKNLTKLDRMDAEHAHFMNIPDEYLVEFDNLYVSGWLAGNGTVETY
jgi:hypothetical protein